MTSITTSRHVSRVTRRRTFQPHAVAMAAAALCGWQGLAMAQNVPTTTLPTGGVVARGSATINTGGGNTAPRMDINQTSNRAVINWGTFSVGRDATVAHQTPGASAITLHRVVGQGNGPAQSFIDGSITSNGKVFLVNTSGVVFGSTARVNVGSLVASSKDLDPQLTANNFEGFINGQQLTFNVGTDRPAADEVNVLNGAQITTGPNGSILLIAGRNATSAGNLSAPGGNIGIVAATDTTVDVGQSGFVRLVTASTVRESGGRAATVAGGTASASNGVVQIVARGFSGENAIAGIVDGTVLAEGDSGGQGRVEIDATGPRSFSLLSGATIDVSARDAASRAGSVQVVAGDVRVIASQGEGEPLDSTIRADGPAGGGSIVIGDLCADRCSTEQARSVLIGRGSLISADATGNGNGGSIIVSSTFSRPGSEGPPIARTDFGVVELYGTLQARGGTAGGNGGRIETTGPSLTSSLNLGEGFFQRAEVDASARAAGAAAGTWLIRSGDANLSGTDPLAGEGTTFEPLTLGAAVSTTDISATLNRGTNVTVNTDFVPNGFTRIGSGNITLPTDARIQSGATSTLRLEAANDITVESGSLISRSVSSAGALSVVMQGDVDNQNGGVVQGQLNVLLPGGSFTASGNAVNGRSPHGVNLSGNLSADNISLFGLSEQGFGVNLDGMGLSVTPGVAGNVFIRGSGLRASSSTPSSVQIGGVNLGSNIDLLAGQGSVTISGRGNDNAQPAQVGAVGVRIDDLQLTADPSSTGRITIAGQSLGSTAPGVWAANPQSGLEIRSNSNVNEPIGASLVIGASADAIAEQALDLGGGFRPRIFTSGTVNLRPLGVDVSGNIIESTATPIHVGDGAPEGTNFILDSGLLRNASPATGGISATRGLVIGSDSHSGRITVGDRGLIGNDSVFGSGFASPVTLQNQGVGSGGISLSGNIGGPDLRLSLISASDIIQEDAGQLSAQSLVVIGAPTSVVTLNSSNNLISSLSFDGPRTIDVFSRSGLVVGISSNYNTFSLADGFLQQQLSANRAGERVNLTSDSTLLVQDTTLSLSQANATLSLRATDNVSLFEFALVAGAGPMNVVIATGTDAGNVGDVSLLRGESRASITTNGGSVVIGGGADPLSQPARRVEIQGATIDTRGASGAGDITIRGSNGNRFDDPGGDGALFLRTTKLGARQPERLFGALPPPDPTSDTAVQLTGTTLTGNNVTVTALGEFGSALAMNNTTINATGNVSLTGSASGQSAGGTGVWINNLSQVNLSGSSQLLIAGVGTGSGTVLDDLSILGGSRIVLAGQFDRGPFQDLGAGLRNSVGTPGVRIGAAGGGRSAADVLIGASASDGSPAIDMADGLRVQTTGRVNIRPASVDGEGQVFNNDFATIRVGSSSSSSGAGNFAVPGSWLNPTTGIDATQVVIGSQQHSGAITVAAGELSNTGAVPVTLQNQGTESGGIAFEGAAGSSSLNLGLSTTGNITQAGALTANRLVVQGGPGSSVTLASTANRVASISFDPPQSLSLVTLGNLSVDSGLAQGFDATADAFTSSAITTNQCGDSLLLRSLDGNLTLNSSIAMQGSNATVNLVAGNRFANPNNGRINFGEGGGFWRVWTNSATDNTAGGLTGTNLYGCSFGDTTACSASGVAINPTGNLFLSTQRPTLQVTADPQTIQRGAALPTLTYRVTGLVNGDTEANALTGALETSATNSNTAGRFPIRQGTLSSPTGYLINYNNGNESPVSLVIQGASALPPGLGLGLLGGDKLFVDQRTDVYGANSPARPNVCAAVSTIRSASGQDQGLEPLTAEWLRVRGQPQLSGCLQVNNEKACSAF
jgi:filamentous hemagglutinin family protein